MGCVIIGIAGGSGSGKSTFTNKLKALYGDKITVLYHDNLITIIADMMNCHWMNGSILTMMIRQHWRQIFW